MTSTSILRVAFAVGAMALVLVVSLAASPLAAFAEGDWG